MNIMFGFVGWLKRLRRKPEAAFHEAGHVIIAQRLLPRERIRASIDDRGGGGVPGDFVKKASLEQLYRISVAGVLAEARGSTGRSINLDEIEDFAINLCAWLTGKRSVLPVEIPVKGNVVIQAAWNKDDFFWLNEEPADLGQLTDASRWVGGQLNDQQVWNAITGLKEFLMKHGQYDSARDPLFI